MPHLAFIRPLSPSTAAHPPKGSDWLHEPKWDGFRFQIIQDGGSVRLYSRHGAEYTDRLPGMVEAFAKLPARTAILDRRTVPDRAARWGALLPADDPDEHARTDEAQLAFLPLIANAAPVEASKEDPAPPKKAWW